MRMVIYVEVDSEKQRDLVWERLENMVETDELSGFFTLTVDGAPCVQDAHRQDLDRLAEAVADAELAEEDYLHDAPLDADSREAVRRVADAIVDKAEEGGSK
jgi:hypothetical protein